MEIRATEHILRVSLAGDYVASRLTCSCDDVNVIAVDICALPILLACVTTQPYVAAEADTGRDEANRENTKVYRYPNPFS